MSIKSSSQISLTDLTDAYSILLTSETYTFAGEFTGAQPGLTCTTKVVAYCGSNQCTNVNVGTIECPTGISATITDNGGVSPTITFTTTSIVTDSCEATIPITVDGVTISKMFSFSVAMSADSAALDDLTERVSQTEVDLDNKVTKGTVSSEISQEDGIITISGERLIVDTTNLKISKEGNIDCSNINITGGCIDMDTLDKNNPNIILRSKYYEITEGDNMVHDNYETSIGPGTITLTHAYTTGGDPRTLFIGPSEINITIFGETVVSTPLYISDRRLYIENLIDANANQSIVIYRDMQIVDNRGLGVSGNITAMGTVTGTNLRTINSTVRMWDDTEGGHISISSPNGVHYEMDAYDDNFRIVCIKDGRVPGYLKILNDGTLLSSGRIISQHPDGLRITWSNIGFLTRFDGSNAYFLFTNANDPFGNWTAARPLILSQDGSGQIGSVIHSRGSITSVVNINASGQVTANILYAKTIIRSTLISRTDTADNGYVNFVNTSNSAYAPIRAGGFTNMSSEKTKEHINDMTIDEARKLLDIDVISFDYKENFGGKKDNFGVLAEQVISHIPYVVDNPEEYDENSFDESKGIDQPLMGVDYIKFVPYLIKMIQIQQKEIEDLKSVMEVK